MSLIYAIRHGQASFGSRNYDILSEKGKRQSRILGDYLDRTGILFDTVFSGRLKRQTETAHHVMTRLLPPHKKPDIRISGEFDEFDAEAVFRLYLPILTREDPGLAVEMEKIYSDNRIFEKLFDKVMGRWIIEGKEDETVESWQDFMRRVEKGVGSIIDQCGENKTIALFTSGGVISVLAAKALQIPDKKTLGICWRLFNSSFSVFRYAEDAFSLVSLNETPHLDLLREKGMHTFR